MVRAVVVQTCVLLGLGLLGPVVAVSEEPRHHGMPLDDQYDLLIEQTQTDVLRIGLVFRTRPEGGAEREPARLEGAAETGRLDGAIWICQVRCEVVRPITPTYLQARGTVYRITLMGLADGPDHYAVRETPAADARRTLMDEFRRLWVQEEGIRQTALYWAAPMVLSIYKNEGLMPAPMHVAVGATAGAQTRLGEESYARSSLMRRGVPQHAPERSRSRRPGPTRGPASAFESGVRTR